MVKEFRGRYQVHESWADETALDRRSLTLGAALLISVAAAPIAEADDASTEASDSQTHLAEVPLASGATLTIERRGPVALFGINRPHIQNRIDPETFRALAKAYHD
jgi:enoyl-CoA hydratase